MQSTFSSENRGGADGGAFSAFDSSIVLEDVRLTHNSASAQGGAIKIRNSFIEMVVFIFQNSFTYNVVLLMDISNDFRHE